MQIIIAKKGELISCDEYCDLKSELVDMCFGDFYLCKSCLQEALKLLEELKK
jgi:hypothetical protein